MDYTQIIAIIIKYTPPFLLALAVLYFAAGIGIVKYWKDYARVSQGKEIIFRALAYIFWVIVLWLVALALQGLFG